VNGKVLIFRLQILGCNGDGLISTVMGMGNFSWDGEFLTGWDGENLMGMGTI